jgi:hypothetical protein
MVMLTSDSKTQIVPVTVDNFIRAETDWVFRNLIQEQGAFGKFYHFRELAPLDKQTVPPRQP